jgi:hypothetical protein
LLNKAADTPTGTLLSFFDGVWTDDGVLLSWGFEGQGSVTSADIQRSDQANGPWITIIGEPRDHRAAQAMIDRSAEAGRVYFYRLVATKTGGVPVTLGPITIVTMLREGERVQVAPSPSRGLARISFVVAHDANVRLTVIDVQGRVVATLANGLYRAGSHRADWDAGAVGAGLYFLRYEDPSMNLVRKMIVAR